MPAGHYFDKDPAVPSRPRPVELVLPGLSISLKADRGVFSAAHVDPGTLALLRGAPAPPPAGHLLDLGCGYGPIAVALALRATAATVWAVDVNSRALTLAHENAIAVGLTNVVVARPEDVPTGLRFDAIYSNPPGRIGKPALRELLLQWLARLASGGTGHLVVHRHLGADTLAAWLEEQGFATERRLAEGGYRLLRIAPRRLPPRGPSRWVVGCAAERNSCDHVLALNLAEARAAEDRQLPCVALHRVGVSALVRPAKEVLVEVPVWRGRRFAAYLDWLVRARLSVPGETDVTWIVDRRRGRRVVADLRDEGWELEAPRRLDATTVALRGDPPAPATRPEPSQFVEEFGDTPLTFRADWGVFSASGIDDGTKLLAEVAARHAPVDRLLDVGTGYGALAIMLVRSGVARAAFGTDVDAIALLLAETNARANGVVLSAQLDDEPSRHDGPSLVVCNFPTHLATQESVRLLADLVRLAGSADVLFIVHASLEERFRARCALLDAGARTLARSAHAVLQVTR